MSKLSQNLSLRNFLIFSLLVLQVSSALSSTVPECQLHSSHSALRLFSFKSRCETRRTSHSFQLHNGLQLKAYFQRLRRNWNNRRARLSLSTAPTRENDVSSLSILEGFACFCFVSFDGFSGAHRILTATGQRRERQSSSRSSLCRWWRWWWSHSCTLPCVARLLCIRSLAGDRSTTRREIHEKSER